MRRRDLDLLAEIIEAAGNIEVFAARGRAAFERDVMIQYAVAHGLVLIGEAARSLSTALRDPYPDVPWRQILAQRNVVVHEYDRIDLEAVWLFADREVPASRAAGRRDRGARAGGGLTVARRR